CRRCGEDPPVKVAAWIVVLDILEAPVAGGCGAFLREDQVPWEVPPPAFLAHARMPSVNVFAWVNVLWSLSAGAGSSNMSAPSSRMVGDINPGVGMKLPYCMPFPGELVRRSVSVGLRVGIGRDTG